MLVEPNTGVEYKMYAYRGSRDAGRTRIIRVIKVSDCPSAQCSVLLCGTGNLQEFTPRHVKAALYTIVPRSPFFAFCTPKYCRLQKCG